MQARGQTMVSHLGLLYSKGCIRLAHTGTQICRVAVVVVVVGVVVVVVVVVVGAPPPYQLCWLIFPLPELCGEGGGGEGGGGGGG